VDTGNRPTLHQFQDPVRSLKERMDNLRDTQQAWLMVTGRTFMTYKPKRP
jgi:hypothetical protein